MLSPQIIDRRHRFRFCAAGKAMWAPCYTKRGGRRIVRAYALTSQFQEEVHPRGKGRCGILRQMRWCCIFAELVFGKVRVSARCVFRVTRNADITADEGMFDHDVDYREIMSELFGKRPQAGGCPSAGDSKARRKS